MCDSEFSKVLIDDDRMIVCKKEDFDKLSEKERQLLISGAFPELEKKRRWFNQFGCIGYKIEYCYKMYSSAFDSQVGRLERENDWEKYPYVALLLFVKDNKRYCKVTPISVEG